MKETTKKAVKARYLLWIVSLLCAVVLLGYAASTKMLPGKYLLIAGLVFVLLFAGFFWWQRKGKLPKLIFIALLEIVIGAGSVYGVNVLYHTNHMVDNITQQVAETVTVSVYVKKDKNYNTLNDVVEQPFGMVKDQSEDSVDAFLQDVVNASDVNLDVTAYAGMFDAADALHNDEIQVLVLDEAYAPMFLEVEGYEWFETETKMLWNSTQELAITKREISSQIAMTNLQDNTQETMEAPAEESKETEENTEEKKVVKKEVAPPKMELMEQPEQVDWNTLVNQDMILAPAGSYVIYISGADTWGQASTKSRSDVNIIAAVNTNTKKILLVSTPRDYYVPLSVSNGVSIPYYVKVNFTGFVNIVNAVGGVDVYSESDFTVEPEFHYVAGMNHLDGIQALAFARERYSFAAGDRARGNHQMEVIRAVINKCISPSILYNYADVMNGVSGSFSTNISKDTIVSLIHMQLNDMAGWDIQSMSVDGSGANKSTYSVKGKALYVMVPNESTVQSAKDRISAVLNGN